MKPNLPSISTRWNYVKMLVSNEVVFLLVLVC